MKYEKGGFIDSLVISIKIGTIGANNAGGWGKTQSGDIPCCDIETGA